MSTTHVFTIIHHLVAISGVRFNHQIVSLSCLLRQGSHTAQAGLKLYVAQYSLELLNFLSHFPNVRIIGVNQHTFLPSANILKQFLSVSTVLSSLKMSTPSQCSQVLTCIEITQGSCVTRVGLGVTEPLIQAPDFQQQGSKPVILNSGSWTSRSSSTTTTTTSATSNTSTSISTTSSSNTVQIFWEQNSWEESGCVLLHNVLTRPE